MPRIQIILEVDQATEEVLQAIRCQMQTSMDRLITKLLPDVDALKQILKEENTKNPIQYGATHIE